MQESCILKLPNEELVVKLKFMYLYFMLGGLDGHKQLRNSIIAYVVLIPSYGIFFPRVSIK